MFLHTQIHPTELEARSEYESFKEWLNTFELYRGKKTGEDTEDDNRIVGLFKVSIFTIIFCFKNNVPMR